MRICSLTSGSKGNSFFIESEKSKILVDCGNTGKMTVEILKTLGQKPEEIDGIFVTHEHLDHIRGVGVMSRKYDIPILANEKTWLAMKDKIGSIAEKNIMVFKTNTYFSFRDLDVHAVNTFHDAVDPVFFIFYQKNKKISIVTDTGIVDDKMIEAMRGSDLYYLEANHDIEMLKNGPYPPILKDRILSDHGHLSNDLTSELIPKIIKAKGESIILSHLSEENNTESLAYLSIYKKINQLDLVDKKDIILRVAPKRKADIVTDLGVNR